MVNMNSILDLEVAKAQRLLLHEESKQRSRSSSLLTHKEDKTSRSPRIRMKDQDEKNVEEQREKIRGLLRN